MKKLIVIFFTFSFLSANTAFGEFLKLPLLIQHYIEHSQEDDASIMDFLTIHYGKPIDHQHNNKKHEHDNLPFKNTHTHTIQLAASPNFQIDAVKIPEESELKILFFPKQNYSNAYLNSIWQPPQVS